jgi:hypothetical protein
MGSLISHLPNNFLSHALSVRALEISQSRVQISLGVNLKLRHQLVVFMRGRGVNLGGLVKSGPTPI